MWIEKHIQLIVASRTLCMNHNYINVHLRIHVTIYEINSNNKQTMLKYSWINIQDQWT
jgi:hypothetical protein